MRVGASIAVPHKTDYTKEYAKRLSEEPLNIMAAIDSLFARHRKDWHKAGMTTDEKVRWLHEHGVNVYDEIQRQYSGGTPGKG